VIVTHPAWIEVDLDALVHNARVLRRAVPAEARLGILVKANGYGHGIEMAARSALAGGADQLIVAALDEGLALRRAGIDAPVLVAYAIPFESVGEAAAAGLELSLTGFESARLTLAAWSEQTAALPDTELAVHVEVDSGMGRGGVAPEQLAEVVALVAGQPRMKLVGVWSHLASGSDAVASGEQARRYESALASLAATGRSMPMRHLLATEAIFAATASAYDMVRVGLAYYGGLGVDFEPAPAMAALAADLRPAMAVKARPVRLEWMAAGSSVGYGGEWQTARRSLIATLPIGYADGWSRLYWPGAEALVRGVRVPLVGRVSMDSVCADVTDAEGVTYEDEFVLLGSQGEESITVTDLARLRGSIPNEVFCDFGPRLPRLYLEGRRVVAVLEGAGRLERIERRA
jgi:alanine racemase